MKKIPSKHWLVSRHLEDVLNTSSALQSFVFQDVLKTSCKYVLKKSSKTKKFYVELVMKMPWKRLEDMSWRHLEDMSWRRLEDMSWRCLEDMSWRHVLKTSCRHYRDKRNTYWRYLYLTNLNVYLTNLYLTHLHLTTLRRIQNALSSTHHFNICLILEIKQHLYSRIKISDNAWCCEISWSKIRHCKKGEAIKTNF